MLYSAHDSQALAPLRIRLWKRNMNSSSIYADPVDGFLIKSRFGALRGKKDLYKIKGGAAAFRSTNQGRMLKWEKVFREGFIEIDFN